MKIKTSWARLILASKVGAQYLKEHPEKTKLEYAIQRSLPRIAKTNDELQELLDGIDADHAVTGKVGGVEGVILRSPQNMYQFKPEQQRACNAARRKLLSDPEGVEIDAYFAITVPDGIAETYLDAFEGIIIRPEDVERIRAAREAEPEIQEGDERTPVQVQ